MNEVLLLSALVGATLIIVRGTILRRVRVLWPALLGCSQCTGTWVGIVAGATGIVSVGHGRVVDAIVVGIAQTGALIPGVSRSGSTLTAALMLGFKRDEAARLSFLLGLPAIALAGFKELWELHKIHLDWHAWSVLFLGIGVAAISAFFAIWGLMKILENFSSWPFIVYRFLLGVVILAGVAMGWLA